jgi:hypothetical protein
MGWGVGGGWHLLYTSQCTTALAFGGMSDCRSAKRLQRAGRSWAVEQLKWEESALRSRQWRQSAADMVAWSGGMGGGGGAANQSINYDFLSE